MTHHYDTRCTSYVRATVDGSIHWNRERLSLGWLPVRVLVKGPRLLRDGGRGGCNRVASTFSVQAMRE